MRTEGWSRHDLQKALVQVGPMPCVSSCSIRDPLALQTSLIGWLHCAVETHMVMRIVQVYLRMDELLMRDEARPELEGLAGDNSPTDSG